MAKTGKDSVRAVFQEAAQEAEVIQEVAAKKKRGLVVKIEVAADALATPVAYQYLPGEWMGAPYDQMPPDCPVTPLGSKGTACYFFNERGEFMDINLKDLAKKGLMLLFASTPNYLEYHWPRGVDDTGKRKIGVDVDNALACLLKECNRLNIFDASKSLRGRGAWHCDDGSIVWHAGNRVFSFEEGQMHQYRPGKIKEGLYPASGVTLYPCAVPVTPETNPSEKILAAFNTWSWARQDIDPLLLLGWVGSAFLGGALPWRTIAYITGDAGQGKSTLQTYIKGLFGEALISGSSDTAASIYQRMDQDALPVFVDENEPSAYNQKAENVLAIARVAASGDSINRGGANGKATSYLARSSFLMSSINVPSMESSDRSRAVMFRLRHLDRARTGTASLETGEDWGGILLRKLLQEWHLFEDYFRFWRNILQLGGLDERAQYTYGIVLTHALMLLGENAFAAYGLPMDNPPELAKRLALATQADREGKTKNWEDCLDWIRNSSVTGWAKGDVKTIGEILKEFRAGLKTDQGGSLKENEQELNLNQARKFLSHAGLGLLVRRDTHAHFLAIPVSKQVKALNAIFKDTHWRGTAYVDALKQAPQEVLSDTSYVLHLNGKATRCLLIDLRAYLGSEMEEADTGVFE